MAVKNSLNGLPGSLINIIDSIENDDQIDCTVLIDIISRFKLSEIDFLPFNTFNHAIHESYGRKRIFEGRNFSVFIMSWSPGDFTAIHSHGISDWGAVYFFGEVDHRLYKVNGDNIDLSETGMVYSGSIVPVKGNLVHAMGNLRDKPVMSLHIYGTHKNRSNANVDSFVFELEKKRIRTTDGSAYINISDQLCKTTSEGVRTNLETITDYFNIIQAFYEKNRIESMTNYLSQVLKNPKRYLEDLK